MDTQFELKPLVGFFGLYKWYVIKDVTWFYNQNGRRQVETFLEERFKFVPHVNYQILAISVIIVLILLLVSLVIGTSIRKRCRNE